MQNVDRRSKSSVQDRTPLSIRAEKGSAEFIRPGSTRSQRFRDANALDRECNLVETCSRMTLLRNLNRSPIWHVETSLNGFRFRAPSLDRLTSLWLHKLGVLGKEEFTFLSKVVRSGMTIAEVGANQGIYTLYMSRLAAPGRVFAYEPEPVIYDQLAENVRINAAANILCQQLAITNENKSSILRPGSLNSGDNRIVDGMAAKTEDIFVNATTLDCLFPDERIDLIKIDVQGLELQVLEGARELLQRTEEIILLLEYWPYGLNLAGSSAAELLTFLDENGFHLWRTTGSKLKSEKTQSLMRRQRGKSYCNIIAARKSLDL
jgi:FkbM family methyltransferase